MRKIILTTVLCALALPSLSAFAKSRAQCPYYPQAERIPIHKVQQQLLRRGYSIHGFGYEHNCLEVKVWNKRGQRSKFYINAKSGRVTYAIHQKKGRKIHRHSKNTHRW